MHDGTCFFDTVEDVLDDDLIFKLKLGVGDEQYKSLTTTENLKDFLATGTTGALAFGAANWAWFSSMGVLGKSLAILGLAATPAYITIAAPVAMVATFAGLKVSRSLRKKSEAKRCLKVAKFVDTPLEFLAHTLAGLLVLPAIKIANSDGEFSSDEREYIVEYFCTKWGYNKHYIQCLLRVCVENADSLDPEDLARFIKDACKSNTVLELDKVQDLLFMLLEDVMHADGKVERCESDFIRELKAVFV